MNDCFLFHDWTKWSEPKDIKFQRLGVWGQMSGKVIGEEYKKIQYRTCNKCGKYEENII